MKKMILAVLIMAASGVTTGFGQNSKTETTQNTAIIMTTFGVRGNCNMCKNTIEKAAKSVIGVSKVNWNKDTKSIQVGYNKEQTDVMAIHKAIAASGYDTEKLNGDSKVYRNLPGCCKYDREMKMSLTGASVKEKEAKHKR
jgi:copper chaperone CopZ